jgi:D-sorbitol dehydrogenase (acceptor)
MKVSFVTRSAVLRLLSFSQLLWAICLAGGLGLTLNAYAAESSGQDLIKRGEYLAKVGDCAACHRTSEVDGKPYAGGYVISSPMGNIIASNITPSKQYGIGNYSEEQFAKAVRFGVNAKGQNLYPAMPYTSFNGISDDDMHALYVYFMQGVAPVNESVAETRLSFPFNQRWLMSGWNLLFLHDGKGFTSHAAQQQDPVSRGKYLVDTLGHCSTCHTPRNMAMAETQSKYLSGSNVSGWFAPNITSDPLSGIGGWSQQELADYLHTGHATGKGQAAGGMAEAVEHSLQYLTPEDTQAIAAYLKQVPAYAVPASHAEPSAQQEEPITRQLNTADANKTIDGRQLYMGACASCHRPDGQGTPDHYYPSLTANTATGGMDSTNLIMAVLHGVQRNTQQGDIYMPAFGQDMNDQQVAAVSNYVLSRFGNARLNVTADQVKTLRSGGEKPLLVKMLIPAAIGIIILLLVLVIIIARHKSNKRNNPIR